MTDETRSRLLAHLGLNIGCGSRFHHWPGTSRPSASPRAIPVVPLPASPTHFWQLLATDADFEDRGSSRTALNLLTKRRLRDM